jgi:integrase/recombinase XerD
MSTRTTSNYFSAIRAEYANNSLSSALEADILTKQDADLIREFIAERRSVANISQGRTNKVTYTLVSWRRFVGPFSELGIADVYAGIEAIKTGKSQREKPFKQNTISDHVIILKQFLLWLIEEGYSTLPEKKVRRIKNPKKETVTKKATDLLTPDEITKIVRASDRSIDRAMMLLLYEGGFRIGEIATLTWGDLQFVAGGVSVGVLFKTQYYRHIRVVLCTEYLKVWKADYPGEPTSDALVFINENHEPFTHATISKRIKRIVKRAGITKHITAHIFRHSRITHLIKEGMRESAIKKMMWGQADTTMWKTYVHLTGHDIDAEVSRLYGITEAEEDKEEGVKPRQCPHCAAINPPGVPTCYTCGEPLDPLGAAKLAEVAAYIVNHGDAVKRYIDSVSEGKK